MAYKFKNTFECEHPEKINTIAFFIIYRNNFVGYLNGKEIVRKDLPDTTETIYEQMDLSQHKKELHSGKNEFLIEFPFIPKNSEQIFFDVEILLI